MNITILDNREIIIKTSDTFGTQNENKATVFNFSFPESLINANKKIVFITDDGVYWDLITNNSYKITNAVTKYKTVSAYVWLVDVEKDIDFRSKSLKITFNKNEEPDDVVPTEEEISGFDTMIAQLNTAIAEVDNIDIDAEKVGDTATVTITNKQGTQKSVEIKDGSDYIITEDDYREIANIVEADLPENYYNKTETNNLLAGKVDKETGKSLIETSKIEKLDGIETGAEVNIVEDIKVNGTSLEVEEKAVNIPVPTELKDLTDDSTHRTVTDTEKNTWNNKADMSDIPDVSGFITKDVNNLTNYTLKTATGSLIDLEINSSNYVVSLSLKDIDGNVISTDTIDLPLESVVVGGSYDATNKKIVLTLENGNTVDIPIGDLIAGLQTEITSQNKLASDLVDDSNSGNKFVNTSEKQAWNAKYDKPAGGIPKTDLSSSVGASLDKADSAIQEADLADYVKNTDYATSSKGGVVKIDAYAITKNSNGNLISNIYDYNTYGTANSNSFISKGTLENVITGKNLETANNKVTEIDENSTDTEYPSAKLLYDQLAEKQEQIDGLVTENALLKDQIPNGTAEGTTVQITDSSNLPIEDGVIKGYTSQVQYEGRNQWDENTQTFYNQSYFGKSIKDDKNVWTFTVTGNGYAFTESTKVLPAGTYIFSAIVNNGNFLIMQGGNILANPFTLTEETTISLRVYKSGAVPGDVVTLSNVMLEQGSTAHDYEPYTGGQPSPNPDFPQIIHTVTGDCGSKISSYNQLGIVDGDYSINNISVKVKSGIISIVGEISANTNIFIPLIMPILINKGEKNTLTAIVTGNTYTEMAIRLLTSTTINADNSFGNSFFSLSPNTATSLNSIQTETKTYNYLMVRVNTGHTYNVTIKTQLESGLSYTTYSEFQGIQNTPLTLGNIELCKIGDYQDYLFKNVRTLRSGRVNPLFNPDLDEEAWYKYEAINKVVFDGSENWMLETEKIITRVFVLTGVMKNASSVGDSLSNYFKNNVSGDAEKIAIGYGNLYIAINKTTASTVEEFKTWLSTHNTEVYYVIATPTYEEITDTTLISQLEAYYNSSTYRNVTNIITAGDDLAPIASIVYKKDLTTLFNRLDSLEARVDLLE